MPIWESIPREVKAFLLKATAIFIVWKLLFHLLLQPAQWPDAPLVKAIATQTSWLLNTLSGSKIYTYEIANKKHKIREGKNQEYYEGTSGYIYKNAQPVLLIVPNCNGLELMVLFAGFIISFPGSIKRKLLLIPLGIVIIHSVNILRCSILISMSTGPLKTYFHFAHHYLFSITIYLVVFLMWAWYVKTEQKKITAEQ